ncbi:hypothetical protein ACJIZ3_022431 [Penstemon smallii]|uniref:Pentatricopeptide repeat-containing protein n=1 Tax=Penstemon smallii TaxID=265156 RepID=A0ABD3TM73_9LAMI
MAPPPQLFASKPSTFPPALAHLFSKPPTTRTKPIPIEKIAQNQTQNAKPTKPKKARDTARLINDEPWSARIESHLSTLNPLSQTTFFQTLRLIKTPSKALQFFNWARNSGFTHTHTSYFMMLEILGRGRNLNFARNFLFSIPNKSENSVQLNDKFFNSLIRSYGDAGLFQESLKVFKTMKSMAISPSVVTFNCLLSILLKKCRVGMVYEVYDEMLRTYGVKPDVYTFNLLIRGFCMNSRVDEAFRMFKEMEKFDCEPDLITYNTIVDGLCRAGKVKIAQNVVNGMYKKSEDMRPNVVTYTTLIRGYCGKQEINEALETLKEMVDSGIKPNEVTYNTIIKGFCECQKFDTIKEILGECQGFLPDTCTFNTMINAHCSRDNLEEAFKVFEKMKEINVKQDSATYSMLIRALCKKGNFIKAQELLDELYEKEILLHNKGCIPLAASYNPIFEYLCKNGKTKKAERVFRQLMKRGTQDPCGYKTIILGHCKEGTFENGHKLLVLMLRRDFVPDFDIYESLIEGLLKKREPSLAYDTLQKMLRSSHLPRTSKFHHILMELIKQGSAQESASLLMLMLDKEIRPNIILSTDTIRVLFKSGLKTKAFEVVKSLYEKGYIVSMKELVLFLCEDKKLLEACELLVFSLKNDQSVDIDVFGTVLDSLCKVQKFHEAFHLYYELLEKGIQERFSCLEELRNGLEGEGKSKEAEFVQKRMMTLESPNPLGPYKP